MYKKTDREQLSFEEFMLPFGGKLLAENRWVETAKLMPWDVIEDIYEKSFSPSEGRPSIKARIAFGSIYIKEQESFVDERTVEHIAENPYMQYFLGLPEFRSTPLFDSSMMVHFRKRFNAEAMKKINEALYKNMHSKKDDADNTPPPDSGIDKTEVEIKTDNTPPPDSGTDKTNIEIKKENHGKLILDATVAPSDIRYPTDLSLLNECRENTEVMIDQIWKFNSKKGHKTAYNRKKARNNYLKVAKQRKAKSQVTRKAIGEQLDYNKKNIDKLNNMSKETGIDKLTKRQLDRFRVIEKTYLQQQSMYNSHVQKCDDRIINLRQPHVRCIMRGKAGKRYEFGQKLHFSIVDGFTFIEDQKWDNYNEGICLIASAERYKERIGVYPEAILADTIYRNKDNRKFCKENGIRLSGPRLGRPKASEVEADKELAYKDSCERNIVESRNGISKRRYGLDLIMAYLPETAETEAALQVFVMNVAHCLRSLLRHLLRFIFYRRQCYISE
jgi:transposase, IS5 family